MHDPIAYTYDADIHCADCTRERFPSSGQFPGYNDDTEESFTDSEGNEVGAISPWEEWWDTSEGCESLTCADCHAVLDNAHADQCEENFGTEPCALPESLRV